ASDPRFALEVELLSRIHSPHVPGLHDSGEWTRSDGAHFPFLVIDWVDGLPLYSWARLQPRSSREVLRLLAQIARALQAVHAAGGHHRDVKGDNVLVRPTDGSVVLADFGSCTYRGAPILTRQSEPPSTPQYQSPQSQLHQWKFRHQAPVRYEATPADDLYALGVTAYRLVAGRYPLIADEQDTDDEDDVFSRFPSLVHAENLVHLAPELAKWIRQMLSVEPEDRGSAAELALGLDLAAERAGREADRPITPRADAAPRPFEWRKYLATVAVSGVLTAGAWGLFLAPPGGSPTALARALTRAVQSVAQEGTTAGLGEDARSEPVSAWEPLASYEGIGAEVPKRPLPSQRVPPCKRPEVEINDACWLLLGSENPPCVERTYEWKKRCYWPSFSPSRPTTTGQDQ
ncbi:serine/threonine-protein kinase, partial [Hyalangium sp.]|uniref:serine/threonine-protein kinase n=1 Tax=Hyalangium sp. TaxID=2028555 RepID=UPI002D4FF2E3